MHITIALIFGIATGCHVYLPDYLCLPFLTIFLITLPLLNNDTIAKGYDNGYPHNCFKGLSKFQEYFLRRSRFVLLILYVSLFLFGIININLYLHPKIGANHIIHYADNKPVIMEGIITESPQFSPDKIDLIVEAANIISGDQVFPVEGRALIAVKGYYPFQYGDYLRFTVNLKTPNNFQNPGGFDYKKYLLYRCILVRGFIYKLEKIAILRQNEGNPVFSFVEKYRRQIKAIIYERAESPSREIIQAMILGNQKEINTDIMEKFNRTGVSHIIAISGFNVGIIAVFSLFMIRFVMKSSETFLLKYNMITLSTLFALIPVIIFCFIAGMGISIVRATIMAAIFMVAILIGRQRDLYNTLALAAFLILIAAPYSLFDVSFQLSFVAVLAILFITPRLSRIVPSSWLDDIRKLYPFSTKLLISFGLFIAVTVSATLGTLPLIFYYFNRLSFIVLLANLFVVPILGVLAIPISMAIILTASISSVLSIPFIFASDFLVGISLKVVDFFDSIPGASRLVTTPSLPDIAAYYALLFSAFAFFDRKKNADIIKKRRFILTGICLCAITFLTFHSIYSYNKSRQSVHLTMTAIDVGQGSSTLFELPGGKTVLVDGGGFPDGSFDIGKNVVAPFLLKQQIKKIDFVVLTHPHPDHLGGLIYILENFNIGEIWSNGQYYGIPLYQNFLAIIRNRGIVHRIFSEKTEPFAIGCVSFEMLHPEEPLDRKSDLSEKYVHMNDNSLVMRISYGKTAFLLTGDISSHTEQRLVVSGKDLKSDVLIVPHHGGFASSNVSFIQLVQPRVAVISCGKNNVYKVPHPDVLRRFNNKKASILRTDEDGAVTIKTDGTHLSIATFRSR